MDFDVDFGTLVAAGRPAASGPLFASVDGMVAQLSPEECAFQARGSEQVHVMTLDVLKAMGAMQRFAPLEHHYERIEQALPALQGQRPAIEQVVRFLIDRGLVVGDEAFLARADAAAKASAPTEPLVVVRTHERPESLRRLVASLAGTPGAVAVIDDSRDPATVAENRVVVAALGDRGHHLDRAWRGRLVRRLADAGGGRAALEALLLPAARGVFTGGAGLNAALLLAAGGPAVLLDDDMVWEPRLPSDARLDRTKLAPVLETPVRWLAAGDGLGPAPDGWFAKALAGLGQPLAQAAAGLGAPLDPASLARQELRTVERLVAGARVRTIHCGYYGDSGMDTRLWLYLPPPAEGRGWWSERSTYFEQLRDPRIRHGYPSPQVTEAANFTPTLLDASTLVPPAPPCYRGEDLTLATFLRFFDPQGVNLSLPVLLRHERPGERPPENPDAFTPWTSRFFAEYAMAHADECEAASPTARAAHLAGRFEDLVDARAERLLAILREFLAYLRARIVQRLQQRLAEAGGTPDHFRTDLRAWIEANGRALTTARPPRLRGWPDDLDAMACAEALRGDARAFAGWLRAWPAIWQACVGERDQLLRL